MQERRATVRLSHRCRAHYCPSEDLLPRDGAIINLSERGAGLLAGETRQEGERVTLTWSLPEETETLTATGVVQWSHTRARTGRWYPSGLEWLPMEDSTRHRLETFLRRTQPTPSTRTAQRSDPFHDIPAWVIGVLRAGVVFGLLVGAWCLLWGLWLQRENRQLDLAIQQRNAMIEYLEQRGVRLTRALGSAQSSLAQTTKEVARLDQQTQHLEGTLEQANQQIELTQQAYVKVREEREALMERVLDLEQQRRTLEQERTRLAGRLSSIPDLRQAIHEAIEARKQEQRTQRREFIQAQQDADRHLRAGDNRGYVVLDGQPTVSHSTIWIRVHEPDTVGPTIEGSAQ